MPDPKTNSAIVYPECVEHGIWTPIPRKQPTGPLLLKLKDVDADESSAIKSRGVMSFHVAGCTADFANHVPQTAVAQAMALQIHDPMRYGGYHAFPRRPFSSIWETSSTRTKTGWTSSGPTSRDSITNTSTCPTPVGHPRNIFAVAGNHDGKDSSREENRQSGTSSQTSAIWWSISPRQPDQRSGDDDGAALSLLALSDAAGVLRRALCQRHQRRATRRS